MRILIVEDELTSLKAMEKMLESYGEVSIATNGEEAFDLFSTALEVGNPFDLVCLDIMMPKYDGVEVLEEIRAVEQERGIVGSDGAKVIITTGDSDTDTYCDASAAGCTSYLVKPIERHKLINELKRLGFVQQ